MANIFNKFLNSLKLEDEDDEIDEFEPDEDFELGYEEKPSRPAKAKANDVSYEDALNKVLKDKFLKKIGCTEEEIQKACEEFDIHYYLPSAHSMCAEPHDHWFNISIVPVENDKYELSDQFISKRIKAIKENQK